MYALNKCEAASWWLLKAHPTWLSPLFDVFCDLLKVKLTRMGDFFDFRHLLPLIWMPSSSIFGRIGRQSGNDNVSRRLFKVVCKTIGYLFVVSRLSREYETNSMDQTCSTLSLLDGSVAWTIVATRTSSLTTLNWVLKLSRVCGAREFSSVFRYKDNHLLDWWSLPAKLWNAML